MTFKRREVEQALQKKGFEKSKGKHKHSIFIYYTSEGKKTDVRTLTSHGSGGTDIGDPLLGRMASQCKISKLSVCTGMLGGMRRASGRHLP